jgi:aquaporin Z
VFLLDQLKKLSKASISTALAEFIGAFSIVFFGCGFVVFCEVNMFQHLLIWTPVIFGSVVCLMIYLFADISGAHFNPAVTIAFASVKKHPWNKVGSYVFSQVSGAIVACFLLMWLFPATDTFAATKPAGISFFEAFYIEFILGFLLMFVIKVSSREMKFARPYAAPSIGAVIILGAFLFGETTGASMNPARSIAPQLRSLERFSVQNSQDIYDVLKRLRLLIQLVAVNSFLNCNFLFIYSRILKTLKKEMS